MPKRLAFSYGLLLALSTAPFAQNANDFMQMFGGMMQQAMRQAAQSEWRRVSPSELSCLDQTLGQKARV